MDSAGFRIPQLPKQPKYQTVKKETDREINSTKTYPAPDNRYQDYAAISEDGNFITDYRQACVTRAPPGQQFAVKQWTVHNAEQIAQISRRRQAESTGHVYGTANTELPGKLYQQCTVESCSITPANYTSGVGIERLDKAPPLFGTFTFKPQVRINSNHNHISLNKEFAGGANTPSRWSMLYA